MNPYPPTPDPQSPQSPQTPQAPQTPASVPGQTPPAPLWQPAPPSYVGQPQYGAPPAPTPAPSQPYGQYGPPSQYPAQPYGQFGPPSQYPAQPYGQYGPPSQYPGQAYGQYGPPSQYPQPAYPGAQQPGYAPSYAGTPKRNTGLMIGAGILVVAVLAFFVLRGGGSSSLTGTWIGPFTITDSSSGSNLQTSAAIEMNLTESSSGQVSGSAYGCDANSGSSGSSVNVSGTHSGSSVTLTIATVQYTGQISGGHLTLQASESGATVSVDLHRGSDADYQSLCGNLATPSQ